MSCAVPVHSGLATYRQKQVNKGIYHIISFKGYWAIDDMYSMDRYRLHKGTGGFLFLRGSSDLSLK